MLGQFARRTSTQLIPNRRLDTKMAGSILDAFRYLKHRSGTRAQRMASADVIAFLSLIMAFSVYITMIHLRFDKPEAPAKGCLNHGMTFACTSGL